MSNGACPIFVGNQTDDNHCLQAALLIVLNSLGRRTDWSEIESLTSFDPGLYTWTVCGAAVLANLRPGSKLVAEWDYGRFAAEGESYLMAVWSPEWLAVQRAHASQGFEKERAWAEAICKAGALETRRPALAEIIESFKANIVIALVNSAVLYDHGVKGGHYIVLFGADDKNLFVHDPGLPPRAAIKISKEKFERASRHETIIVPHNGYIFGLQTTRHARCFCRSGKKFMDCHGLNLPHF